MLLALLAACNDYRLGKADLHGGVDAGDTSASPRVEEEVLVIADGSAHATLQRASWGSSPTQCALEVAFTVPAEPVEPEEGPSTPGVFIEVPDEPGTCAYTAFSLHDTHAADPIGVRGSVDAGASVQLADSEGAMGLTRLEGAEGIRYRRDDCTPASWPGGRTLDLSVAGSAREGGLPAFTMREVVAVGPDIRRLRPTDAELSGDTVEHPHGTPFTFAWEEVGPRPLLNGRPVVPGKILFFRHIEISEGRIFEALACRALESGRFEVAAADMARLAPDDAGTYVVAQVDLQWYADRIPDTWGSLNSRGVTSLSGRLIQR